MTLKVIEIKAFQAKEKPYKKADANGLYIEVFPNGSKLWRWKYRFSGKEKRLALGAWPDVSLAKARELRDVERHKLSSGIDPALERKKSKATAKIGSANTFFLVAEEFIEKKMVFQDKAPSTIKKARWFLELLKPAIGQMPIADVDPQMLLAALRMQEAKGNYETAKKCRSFASRVFRYAIASGRATLDPAYILQGALTSPKAKRYAAIVKPKKFGELLRAIDSYDGHVVTKYALLIAPHVFVRPGELRHAEWEEFDFDSAIWNIPAGKMKARRKHAVPLSTQVIDLFQQLKKLVGDQGYVFPAFYTPSRPMSENTINVSLRRMGYAKDEMTAHGFRATASTLLNESGKWHPDAIEKALAHGNSSAVRFAYSRGNYWTERVQMAQWWSDHIDKLRDGGEVIDFPQKTMDSL